MLAYCSHFFALVAHFFDCLTHLKLSCIFVITFCDFVGNLGGLGRVLERILEGFSMIFA